MAQVTTTFDADEATVERLLAPRDDVVLEAPAVDDQDEPVDDERTVCHFDLVEGPFRSYRRTVEVERDAVGGGATVVQTTDFRVAIPVWGWLFTPAIKTILRGAPAPLTDEPGRAPWWSPPDRMSARQSTVLALLTVLAMVSGYLGTLLTQTLTFAADEFDASDTAQGITLAVVRVGVVLSLVLVAMADRRGRRSMLLTSAFVGCLVAATGALAPGLVFLGTSQTVARGLSTALAVLIGIVAVEEMPAGSRAYAVSLLAMTGALGAGLAVLSLPLADLGITAWRILYVIPLLFLLAIRWVGRHLPETSRFLAHDEDPPDAVEPDEATAHTHRWRFVLLAMSGFLAAVFTAPAAQFLNEFLRSERDFSAFEITLFTIGTNTPGGIGIIVGGRLADTKGRRIVGAVSLIGGVGLTVLMYLAMGAPMWILSVFGALIGAAAVPALGVYGPELFPTNLRGRANAGITLLAVAGSSLGLLVAGVLIDRLDSFGATMAILAVGPAILAFLVLAFYPETAHLELEEINPEDARPERR